MAIDTSVFLSYRRSNVFIARAVYQDLRASGYDVFLDYQNIDSGSFERIILNQIAARTHFILILTPAALERCQNPDDWVRREIEHAIDLKRNVVPLFFEGFDFGKADAYLVDKLRLLPAYNGVNVPADYFEEAMQRLKTRFLSQPLSVVLHPVPTEEQQFAQDQQRQADQQATPKPTQLSAERAYERGKQAAYEHDFPVALAAFTEAIDLNPDYADAYYNRGLLYTAQRKADLAITDYSMAIALDARHIDSYFQRGEHYRKREIFASAVADYTAVLKLAPAHVDALTGRADVWYALDDYEKAEADYRKAQQLDPENQQLEGRLYVLRQKRAAKRNPIQQLKNYLAAPVNTPTQKVLDLYNQAVMRDKEDGAGKLADLSEAIALKPSFTRAYILRGALYYHQGEFEKALADDTWVIEKLPRNASSRLNRGEVYLAMGNFAAAKEDFEKALSLEKTNIYAQAGLALAYFRLGDVTKARALWEELVEHSPGFKTPIWVEKRLSWHPNLTQILRELLALPI